MEKHLKTFIRLDQVGHWKGKEHNSSFLGMAEETYFENGISCYKLNAEGIARLYRYWIEYASFDKKDAERFQITIFKGHQVGYGSDGEVIAECIKTVKELPALIIYNKWMELKKRFMDDMETEACNITEYIEENADEILALIGGSHIEN
ncbi:hypothetical protein [Calidifontibacillus erzurumensis]|uniref:hypothetical protein n=1 Tax=Calidifontibacillus erzurumensis TaxID=2741433 RepID=UPI0035B4FCE1